MAHHWLDRVETGVKRANQAIGVAKGAYHVGKTLWAGAQAIAPYAALLLVEESMLFRPGAACSASATTFGTPCTGWGTPFEARWRRP
jgi:hypothetical protein